MGLGEDVTQPICETIHYQEYVHIFRLSARGEGGTKSPALKGKGLCLLRQKVSQVIIIPHPPLVEVLDSPLFSSSHPELGISSTKAKPYSRKSIRL